MASATPPDPAVFFAPHQDDETLSMGASIVDHVQADREVIVVLLTDGGNTGVKDQYATWSNVNDLIAERDREFIAAVTRMGATPVIWKVNGVRAHDGSLTTAQASAAMMYYKGLYPDGSFKTMSNLDPEPDHAHAGNALRDLSYPDKRYYLKRADWGLASGSYSGQHNMREALLDYAPVGWLSVESAFHTEFTATGGSKNKYTS
jgi:LmbE family N-acetylglucosaminyl deacetylase